MPKPLNLISNTILLENGIEYIFTWHGKLNDSLNKNLSLISNQPNIKSKVLIKIVLEDTASIDLNALLTVEANSRNSDNYLKIEVLKISDKSIAKVTPSLEIRNNEVKAGHGATIKGINPKYLYFLESRGLNYTQSIEFIIESFLK